MEQLTLRSKVIRETKGQAKQEDPQPQLPCPLPPSQRKAKCALAETRILLTLQPTVNSGGVGTGVGGVQVLERNEASEINHG